MDDVALLDESSAGPGSWSLRTLSELRFGPCRDDVGVVASGDGGKHLGVLYAGLLEDLLVEAHPYQLLSGEPGQTPLLGGAGFLVDDGDALAALLENPGEFSPYPAASDYH